MHGPGLHTQKFPEQCPPAHGHAPSSPQLSWHPIVPPQPSGAVPPHWLLQAFAFGVQPHTPGVPPPPHVLEPVQPPHAPQETTFPEPQTPSQPTTLPELHTPSQPFSELFPPHTAHESTTLPEPQTPSHPRTPSATLVQLVVEALGTQVWQGFAGLAAPRS